MTSADYEPYIQAAYEALLAAESDVAKRLCCDHFTALIRARNAERTEQEIARLERAKGLR